MLNGHKINASKNFSLMSKGLFVLIGSVIYVSVICIDLPKSLKQASFAISFACFVGSLWASNSERILEEILTMEDDVLSQAQQDSLYARYRPKNLKPMAIAQISPEHDFPLIPWG